VPAFSIWPRVATPDASEAIGIVEMSRGVRGISGTPRSSSVRRNRVVRNESVGSYSGTIQEGPQELLNAKAQRLFFWGHPLRKPHAGRPERYSQITPGSLPYGSSTAPKAAAARRAVRVASGFDPIVSDRSCHTVR